VLAFHITKPGSSAAFTMIVIGMHRDLVILVAADFKTFVLLMGMPEDDSEDDE
jgi:hypothetical protein